MSHQTKSIEGLATPRLLPCPFCGAEAAWGEGEQKTKYGNEQVYCSDCCVIAPPKPTKEEAAEWWNTRTEGNAAKIEALTAALKLWVPVCSRLDGAALEGQCGCGAPAAWVSGLGMCFCEKHHTDRHRISEDAQVAVAALDLIESPTEEK
jgi:Lar family restriction alleviation protein